MLVLTNDTFTFTVPDSVAAKCGTLRTAAEAATGDGDAAGDERAGTGPVPLPNVSSAALARVVQFYARLETFERAAEREDWEAQEGVMAWKAGFFEGMDRRVLYDVMEAANYLDATGLLDDAAAYVANLIKGKTPDQIRDMFLLPRDMTAEDARAAAEEYAWALK